MRYEQTPKNIQILYWNKTKVLVYVSAAEVEKKLFLRKPPLKKCIANKI